MVDNLEELPESLRTIAKLPFHYWLSHKSCAEVVGRLTESASAIELLTKQRDEARAFIRQHFPKDG